MRIGLASDSFGNLDGLGRALERFERSGVERIFFLGGRYADVDAWLARRREAAVAPGGGSGDLAFLAAVRGALAAAAGAEPLAGRIARVSSRHCPERAAGVPGKWVDLLEGRICCAVHDKGELDRDDIANASVILHGNAERAALVQIGPRLFVTPGHLRSAPPPGHPATFAELDLGPAEAELTVFSAEGLEVSRARAALAGGARLSVRG